MRVLRQHGEAVAGTQAGNLCWRTSIDHTHDGQEEVYVILEGSAVLISGGTEQVLSAGDMVRLPAETVRSFVTRDKPVRILAIGATPGSAYSPDPQMSAT